MGLLSFFKRGTPPPAAKSVSDSADAVQQLRVRARHRLIGAAVLVGLGVIGFPLLFETQPRPIPVDLPIEIPSKDHVAALKVPAPIGAQQVPGQQIPAQQLPALPAAEAPSPAPLKSSVNPPEPAPVPAQIQALPEANKPTAPKAPEPKPEPKSEPKAESKPAPQPPKAAEKPLEKAAEKLADKSLEKASDKAADRTKSHEARSEAKGGSNEAARVQSLLDGKASDARGAEGSARLVVQVGAYADSKAAQEVRLKLEKLGMKTYTQVAKTPAGDRIRVRIGPFANREEADKAAARIRAAGLSTAVLTL